MAMNVIIFTRYCGKMLCLLKESVLPPDSKNLAVQKVVYPRVSGDEIGQTPILATTCQPPSNSLAYPSVCQISQSRRPRARCLAVTTFATSCEIPGWSKSYCCVEYYTGSIISIGFYCKSCRFVQVRDPPSHFWEATSTLREKPLYSASS